MSTEEAKNRREHRLSRLAPLAMHGSLPLFAAITPSPSPMERPQRTFVFPVHLAVVLVTGASGFLGSHCVEALLEGGYRVRGSVRSLQVCLFSPFRLHEQNAKKVEPIRALDKSNRLELVEADLLLPETWEASVV